MVQSQITFYTHSYSLYSHRVHIALEETKAQYTSVIVDLMNKPAWFKEKVNALGQIPAITYGGPPSPPEDPSPEAIKLNESLVITEFLADIFPAAGLVPADPVKRAQARIFISLVDKQLWDAFKECCVMGKSPTLVVDVLRTLQSRLPEEGFAVGEWSIADIAAAPFLARFVMLLENDLGKYPVGEGKKAFEALKQPEFGRIMRYLDDLKARPSFKATYDEAQTLMIWQHNPVIQRA